jgi:tripartite-type tricarboxylate transporter receptor subunit TctC
MVPMGTPRPIIDRLHAEITAGFGGAELRERFAGIGMAITGVSGPDAFTARLRRDWATFRPVIEQLGIRAE